MHYYEVWVNSQRYHGDAALTYSYEEKLAVGTIAVVPLQKQSVVAVVVRQVQKPSFATKNILRTVASTPLPPELIKTLSWLANYYPAPLGQLTALAVPQTLAMQSRKISTTTAEPQQEDLPLLTTEQEQTVSHIQAEYPKSVLLHGDTGTGKTRVYLELIAKHLKAGRSALLLTPEIGLTPQLALACQRVFGDKTIILHSELSSATRRNTWLHVLEGQEPMVVIGPRSALFAPLRNLGLIVIDEFHEGAYKQEQPPHYLASRVAAKLAESHKAQLLLGSATPPITDYFAFKEKGLPIVRMQEPAIQSAFTDPVIKVIDLKKRDAFSRSPWIADDLLAAIEAALKAQQQSLIFLNRRGTARLILCQTCGWEGLCPRCDLPLTYHGDKHIMQCHTCGYSKNVPNMCPSCGENDIVFRSIGTKSLVEELQRLFPKSVINRFDSDNNKAEKLEQNFESIRSGKVDILVGTQVLGKGLDLPKLSVVGVVVADTSLSFPDYTAEERTFQLLTQVLGRISRGHNQGVAFIQSYHPSNAVLQAAIKKDYQAFYVDQLAERKLYGFPPHRFLLKLTCTRASSAAAKRAGEQLATKLHALQAPIEVIGPGPAFIEKIHNRYRWQIVVKAVQRSLLVNIIKDLPANWSYDIDPVNLL